MALTPEDIKDIQTDLDRGSTPLVVTGPDQSVLGALISAFKAESLIDVSRYRTVGSFGDQLLHIVMHTKGKKGLVLIHDTHRASPDLTKSLRALASTKSIAGVQLPSSLQFIYVARDTKSGLAFSPFGRDLEVLFGIVLRETKFTPKLGAPEITQGLKDLRADISQAIDVARQGGDTAESDRLRHLDRCLVLAARGKQDYLTEMSETP